MAFTRFNFSRLWTNREHFPTIETDETTVRADMQFLHDESKSGLNQLMAELEDSSAATTLGAAAEDKTQSNVQAELDKVHKDRHTHENKALLDAYKQTEDSLKDAVDKKHSHENGVTLASITAAFTTELKTSYNRLVSLFVGITSVATTLGSDDTSVPTSKAVNEAIAASGNIPAGGDLDHILVKRSGANYDMGWAPLPGHAHSHLPGSDDPIFPSDIGAASTETYFATISTVWHEVDGDTYYTQSVAVPGILASDDPFVDAVLVDPVWTNDNGSRKDFYSRDINRARLRDLARVDRIVTSDGAIQVFCYGAKPEGSIPIKLKVVR